jgi:hypothetical protein
MVLISILELVLVPSKGCWFSGLAESQELELELLSLTFQKFLLKATQKNVIKELLSLTFQIFKFKTTQKIPINE